MAAPLASSIFILSIVHYPLCRAEIDLPPPPNPKPKYTKLKHKPKENSLDKPNDNITH